MTAIVPLAGALVPAPPVPLLDDVALAQAFDSWVASVVERTRSAYFDDLTHYLRWRHASPRRTGDNFADEHFRNAVYELVLNGKPHAESLVLAFLKAEQARGLAPATVRRRRSVIRSAIDKYRELGLIHWHLDAKLPRGLERRKVRDTKGPTFPQFLAMYEAAGQQLNDLKAARDRAMLALMVTLRVRASEVCHATIADYQDGTIKLLLKGHAELAAVVVPPRVAADVDQYLELRGSVRIDEPLFASLDPGAIGRPLTRIGLYQIVRELARRAGIPGVVSPHRLLHTASTALMQDGFSTDELQAWGRWEKRDTAEAYFDAHQNVAERLSEHLGKKLGK